MGKRNLIMAAATNYDYATIQPFLTSLRKTGYTDNIAFIVGGNDKETIDRLIADGVTLIKIPTGRHLDNRYSWKVIKSLGLSRTDSYYKLFNYICNRRYFYFRDYLLDHPNEFDQILIVDVRDVLFQKDPFIDSSNVLVKDCVHLFEEGITFEQDPYYNSIWVEKIYGKQVLQSLLHQKVICVGTLMGKQKVISDFLNSICREFKKYDVWGLGLDQGAINRLVHNTEGSLHEIHKNGDHIYTVGCVDQVLQDESGRIINLDNEVVPIVHQYDRHDYLKIDHFFSEQ